MSAKHTPGPWSVIEQSDPPKIENDADGFEICQCWQIWPHIDTTDAHALDIAQANARLIAKAPELLESLDALLSDYLENLEILNDCEAAEGSLQSPEDNSAVKARALLQSIRGDV
jgi:hypothetical protein